MKLIYFFRIFLTVVAASSCGILPDRRSDNSGDDFKQSAWIGNFNLKLIKAETAAALSIDTAKVQFLSKDSESNLFLISKFANSWSLNSNFQTASKIEFPIASAENKDIYVNGSSYLIVEKIFQLGESAGETIDSLQSLTFDVMKFAKNQDGGNAKENVRILYFINKEIVFSIGSDLFLVTFDHSNAMIQKFPVPTVVANQIKISKNLSAGLSRNSQNEKVLWVQIDESFYYASSPNDSEYRWRGPYHLYVNGAPPGRTVTLEQSFPDSVEEVFKKMTVLRDDGLYTVQSLAPLTNSDNSAGTVSQDSRTFFETTLKPSFQASCTNCHSSFSDYNTVTGDKRLAIATRLHDQKMPPIGTDENKNLSPEMRSLMASWLRSLP